MDMRYVYLYSRFVRWVLCCVVGVGLVQSVFAYNCGFMFWNKGSTTLTKMEVLTLGGAVVLTDNYMPAGHLDYEQGGLTAYPTNYVVRVNGKTTSVTTSYAVGSPPTYSQTIVWNGSEFSEAYDPRSNECFRQNVVNGSSESQFLEVAVIPTNVVAGLSGSAATAAAAAFVAVNPGVLKKIVLGAGKVARFTPQNLVFNAALAAGVYYATKWFDSLGVGNTTSEGYQPLTAPSSSEGCWEGPDITVNPPPKTDEQKLAEALRSPDNDGTNVVDKGEGFGEGTNYMDVLERIYQSTRYGPTNRPSKSATEQATDQREAGKAAIKSTGDSLAALEGPGGDGGGGGGPLGPFVVGVPDSEPDFWRQQITLAAVDGHSSSFELNWNPLGGPIADAIRAIVNALMRWAHLSFLQAG